MAKKKKQKPVEIVDNVLPAADDVADLVGGMATEVAETVFSASEVTIDVEYVATDASTDSNVASTFGDESDEKTSEVATESSDVTEPASITADGDNDDSVIGFPVIQERQVTGDDIIDSTGLKLFAEIEAIIFASPEPMRASEIIELLQTQDITPKQLEKVCDELVDYYAARNGGFRLEYIKGMGYQFRTVQEAAPLMERQFAARPRPLSKASLETLSIIAYRQPCTRAEIEFVRGVDAGSIIKTLMDRGMITCVGRKEIAGRPMIFGTTDEFLKVFRLSHIRDLPPLESFQPNLEVIQKALDKLENPELAAEGVDVEEFIGDESNSPQEGTGAPQIAETATESSESPDAGRELQGASVAELDAEDKEAAALVHFATTESTQSEDNHDHAPTEMDLPTGNSVETPSGDLDR